MKFLTSLCLSASLAVAGLAATATAADFANKTYPLSSGGPTTITNSTGVAGSYTNNGGAGIELPASLWAPGVDGLAIHVWQYGTNIFVNNSSTNATTYGWNFTPDGVNWTTDLPLTFLVTNYYSQLSSRTVQLPRSNFFGVKKIRLDYLGTATGCTNLVTISNIIISCYGVQ